MKIAGAQERIEDEILDRFLLDGHAMNEAAQQLPPENYQPLSEAAKARIIADMVEHVKDFAGDLAAARSRQPPRGMAFEIWKAAQDRQALRERLGIRAPAYYYWPSGQPVGSLSAAPPGVLKQDHLVPVLADCADLPSYLALVRWSDGRPVKGVPFPREPYLP